MTLPQLLVFAILLGAMALFIWDRWRYDIVALLALLAATVGGLVPGDQAFAGFGHPAVVTVVAIFVVSRGLINAGVVDAISRRVATAELGPTGQVALLTALVAAASAFVNNVGALALLMPVAVWMSRQSGRSPSLLLMPLAFGSLLGGMITLIGTPPNIIIAAARADAGLPAFTMFDFTPVGAGVTVVCVAAIALVGWRLTPKREGKAAPEELFRIDQYLSEVRVPEGSKAAGHTLFGLLRRLPDDAEVTVVGLVREGHRRSVPSLYEIVRAGDALIVEADAEALQALIEAGGLELGEDAGDTDTDSLRSDDVSVLEVVVPPGARMEGWSAEQLRLRERFGVNLLAVARHGHQLRQRLSRIRFLRGDILLLQGGEEALRETMGETGCLPLAERGLRLGEPRRIAPAVGIFVGAVLLAASGLLPAQIAFVAAAVAMVFSRLLTLNEAYQSIDWPIVILLGALLPLGAALETTGGAALIAEQLGRLAAQVPAPAVVGVLLVGTLLLSNVVNNAAAAVLMAPIAVELARRMGVAVDPLLMAVAVGASSAFLTPIGHQSNTLVMEPGGYRFGDYWRLGLPLSLLVTGTAVPLILWVWPL